MAIKSIPHQHFHNPPELKWRGSCRKNVTEGRYLEVKRFLTEARATKPRELENEYGSNATRIRYEASAFAWPETANRLPGIKRCGDCFPIKTFGRGQEIISTWLRPMGLMPRTWKRLCAATQTTRYEVSAPGYKPQRMKKSSNCAKLKTSIKY